MGMRSIPGFPRGGGARRGRARAFRRCVPWAGSLGGNGLFRSLPRKGDPSQAGRNLQGSVETVFRVWPIARDDQLAVRPQLRGSLQPIDIAEQARQVGKAALREGNQRAFWSDVELGDHRLLCIELGLDDLQQVLRFVWKLPETVDQLGGEGLHALLVVEV